jgi:hypothetical protein
MGGPTKAGDPRARMASGGAFSLAGDGREFTPILHSVMGLRLGLTPALASLDPSSQGVERKLWISGVRMIGSNPILGVNLGVKADRPGLWILPPIPKRFIRTGWRSVGNHSPVLDCIGIPGEILKGLMFRYQSGTGSDD